MREYELAFQDHLYASRFVRLILDQSFWQNQINVRIKEKHLVKSNYLSEISFLRGVVFFITAADQSSDLSENLHRLRFRKMSFDTFGDLFHSCIKQFVHFFVKKRFVRSAHDNGNIRFSCGVFFI